MSIGSSENEMSLLETDGEYLAVLHVARELSEICVRNLNENLKFRLITNTNCMSKVHELVQLN